jgi:two-component system heavy metal sensor histidine kinase CusS
MRSGSITLRLALLFSTASTLVLLLVGALIVREVDMHFETMDLEVLDGKLAQLERGAANLQSRDELERLVRTLAEGSMGQEQVVVTVIGQDHRPLVATGLAFPQQLLEPGAVGAGRDRARSTTWTDVGGRYRGISRALSSSLPGQSAMTGAAAISIGAHEQFVSSFLRSLAWSIVGGIAVTALLSWIVAHRGLAPVHAVARVAKRISAEQLGERLPTQSVPAELVDLAEAFNGMLDRLEESFQRLSDFSSDLAHEMRTPISNVMMHTQVALSSAATADEYREVLYSNLEEHERLARMIADMLWLAKADRGLMMPKAEQVDLAAEVRSLFAYYEAFVDERGVHLALSGEAVVVGDHLMLRRAIGNLLSNAIRHTARGNTVTVTLGRDASGVVELGVENPGPDIPPEHLPRLFDRFYRVDPSHANSGEGAGLGLAITQAITQAHRASLGVTSTGGRTRFVIVFARQESAGATDAGSAPPRPESK